MELVMEKFHLKSLWKIFHKNKLSKISVITVDSLSSTLILVQDLGYLGM
jgi:hypothetical protein